MTRRSADWNQGLAQDLKNINFAQEFIRAGLNEGLPIQLVLAKVIRAYGVKEFAKKVKLPSSNLVRTINSKSNPTVGTLNRLLAPFSLEISVTSSRRKRVA